MRAKASAEGEDSVAASLGPAHASALHAALDDLVGGRLDGTGADAEAVEAQLGVVHAVEAAGEVGAFDASGLGGLRGGRRQAAEGGEDRQRAEGQEFALASVDPGSCGCRIGETRRGGSSSEMLSSVVEVADFDPLVDVLIGEDSGPDRAIGQDQGRPEDRQVPPQDPTLPALDLQGAPTGSFSS